MNRRRDGFYLSKASCYIPILRRLLDEIVGSLGKKGLLG